MKKAYFAMDTKNPKTGKYYPVVCPVTMECSNVISALRAWAGNYEIVAAMICPTKKRACEIVTAWRLEHIANKRFEDFSSFEAVDVPKI